MGKINSRAKGATHDIIWKDVIGYEGLYQVSNFGEVRSVPRKSTKGRVLKQYISKHNGYCYVSLSKANKHIGKRVHKLVCKAFMEGIEDGYDKLKTIDHINGDKTDNRLENLRVCSQSENQLNAYKLGLNPICGVTVINLDTFEVYNSYTEASRAIGGKKGYPVARVCRGELSHYRGHHFAHLDDYKNNTIPIYRGRVKKGVCVRLWR